MLLLRCGVAVVALLAAAAVPAWAHGSGDDDKHTCIHDSIVFGAKAEWKARGLRDPWEAEDPSTAAHAVAPHDIDHHAAQRRLQSYSPIRIRVMTDLLEDGA
jgi:hypothetical protein